MEAQSLSTLLGAAYPQDHPQTLRELLAADPDTISHPLAWALRAQAVEVKRSSSSHQINGPKDAFRLLKNGYALHPWTGKWQSYALSSARELVQVPHPRGGTRPMRVSTPIIPKFDDLPQIPRGTESAGRKPAWMLVFGGTPEVLSKDGVARGLATLQARAPIADVLFFSKDAANGEPPTMWSLAAGRGVRDNGSAGGAPVDFPDLAALEAARRTR